MILLLPAVFDRCEDGHDPAEGLVTDRYLCSVDPDGGRPGRLFRASHSDPKTASRRSARWANGINPYSGFSLNRHWIVSETCAVQVLAPMSPPAAVLSLKLAVVVCRQT
jgi:hypothetical protein